MNLNKIISLKEFYNISGIVIGRSDVAGSIGQNKEYVNSKEIFKICKKSFNLIKKNIVEKLYLRWVEELLHCQKNLLRICMK